MNRPSVTAAVVSAHAQRHVRLRVPQVTAALREQLREAGIEWDADDPCGVALAARAGLRADDLAASLGGIDADDLVQHVAERAWIVSELTRAAQAFMDVNDRPGRWHVAGVALPSVPVFSDTGDPGAMLPVAWAEAFLSLP